jgi:hypothetical protein
MLFLGAFFVPEYILKLPPFLSIQILLSYVEKYSFFDVAFIGVINCSGVLHFVIP